MLPPTSAGPPGPERKYLVYAVVLLPLVGLDALPLSRFNAEAFGVRCLWSLVLVASGFLDPRLSPLGRRLLALGNSAIGSFFYLAIVFFTGVLDSPYVLLVPTLPLLVGFIFPEEVWAAIVSGLVCLVGIGLLAAWFHPSRALTWMSLVALASFFGVYGSAQFREALEARHALRTERARREALEALALTARQSQSEKLATVGRLAASVMHEINNPLAFVRSNLDFLQSELRTQPLEDTVRVEFEEVLGETRVGVERIQQIVTDLRGFSRMDVEEVGPCSLASVVADTVRLAEVRLKHVARVQVDVPMDLPDVLATPRRLVQVLLNLLVNAGDAIEDARISPGEIHVRGEVLGERVVLRVEDNGPGFPPQVLARLFESFFTTKSAEKGTGLGMVISRELLEQFGATLTAHNRPEGGACLRIELPIHRAGS